MKKLLLLAIAALSVSAAQAVTVYWNTGTGTWSGDLDLGTAVGTTTKTASTETYSGSVVSNVGISSTTAWTALCDISITSFDGTFTVGGNYYPTLFGIATEETGMANTYTSIRFRSSTSGTVSVVGTTDAVSGSTTISTTETTNLQLVISYDGNGTLTFVVNGTVWGSSTVDASTLEHYTALVIGQQNANNQTNQVLNTNASYTATTYFVSGSDIYTLVPEPTCLALLALGVAGIALKRKVA